MTQLKLPLSASLTPGSTFSSVNRGNLNTVWLHHYIEAQTQAAIFALLNLFCQTSLYSTQTDSSKLSEVELSFSTIYLLVLAV